MKQRINLRIDELVLDGFDPADRHRIGDAVQRELLKLLKEGGYVQLADADVPSLQARPMNVAARTQPSGIGREIAHTILDILSEARDEGGAE